MTAEQENAIRAWAEARVGNGYIYGAKGQKCSKAFREQQAAQYPDQADYILKTGAKWDGVPVWDCAQLVRGAAAVVGLKMVSGATSQYNKTPYTARGEISGTPEGVCFVYRASGSKMAHTGIYMGDGTVIEARGTEKGVIRSKFDDYPWSHFLIPDIPSADAAATATAEVTSIVYAKIVAESGSTVNARSGPGKSYRVCEKVPLGTVVSILDMADDWARTDRGYIMAAYLQTMTAGEPDPAPEWQTALQSARDALADALETVDSIMKQLEVNANG